MRTYQPNTIVFADTGLFEYGDARWVGNEGGIVPYENWNVIDRHGYLRWRPVEADTPLRKSHWFWHPNDEASLKGSMSCVALYDETVGRGAQLMLGLAPDRRGLLPESDVARLEEFGAAIAKRYGATTNLSREHAHQDPEVERALDNDPDTFWSAPQGSHHSTLEINFARPITFDHALITERLNNGQHVQSYQIEIWDGAGWKSVASDHSIGHKRIETFAPQTASRVRLNILSSTDAAEITKFQLFSLGDH